MNLYMGIYTYIYGRICLRVYILIQFIYTYLYIYIRTYMSIYTYTYACVYIYIYTYVYICIHPIHTHTHTLSLFLSLSHAHATGVESTERVLRVEKRRAMTTRIAGCTLKSPTSMRLLVPSRPLPPHPIPISKSISESVCATRAHIRTTHLHMQRTRANLHTSTRFTNIRARLGTTSENS